MLDTDLKGTILGSKVAFAGMKKQGYGQIFNVEGYGSNDAMMTGLSKSANHHLKWWFAISPNKGFLLLAQKGGVTSIVTGPLIKRYRLNLLFLTLLPALLCIFVLLHP